MIFNETEHGFLFKSPTHSVFFGKKNSQIDSLKISFPEVNFKRIKQVHGNHIVSTSTHSIDFASEADGHYTSTTLLGLAIATADCMPIMIFCESTKKVFSLHAGWRGIAQRILPKALKQITQKDKAAASSLHIYVGPHILESSFEIKQDAFALLKDSALDSQDCFTHDDSIIRCNLKKILIKQTKEFFIDETQIHFLNYDTVTDIRFHSYRRDRESSGRQLSFIALEN